MSGDNVGDLPKRAVARRSPPARARRPTDKPVSGDDEFQEHFEDGEATLVDRAYRGLEELIVTLRLAPRTVLSEQVLAQRLGIGRTPVREALQRLARDGLVTILPRRGILVSDTNLRTHLRLLEVRREIERLLARLAAERATREQRARFAVIADGMKAASRDADDIGFMRLDLEFNALVAEAADNEFASKSIALTSGLSRRFWYQHYKRAADLPLAATLHADLSEAIAQGDAPAAAGASDGLVDYIESFARKTLDA